jgi:hypothetical protein
MIRFLMEAGPFIWPIILLTALIGFLVLWNVVFLLIRPAGSVSGRRKSIDAVLFWGGVAAVLGLLGQWMGIHKITKVIYEAKGVSPPMVTYGLSESLWTPLAGMAVLVGAAILWSLLRLGLWSVERRD